jgi:hypothetical protein
MMGKKHDKKELQEKVLLLERLGKTQEALLQIAELTPDQLAYHNMETVKRIAIKGLMD